VTSTCHLVLVGEENVWDYEGLGMWHGSGRLEIHLDLQRRKLSGRHTAGGFEEL
jgi:hypothetical protein